MCKHRRKKATYQPGTPEATRSQERGLNPPQGLRRSQTCQRPDLGLSASRTVRQHSSVGEASAYSIHYGSWADLSEAFEHPTPLSLLCCRQVAFALSTVWVLLPYPQGS